MGHGGSHQSGRMIWIMHAAAETYADLSPMADVMWEKSWGDRRMVLAPFIRMYP